MAAELQLGAGRAGTGVPLARLLAAGAAEARAQAGRWLLWSPVGFGCGCGGYFALKAEPPLWLGLAGTALAVGLAILLSRRTMAQGLVLTAALLAFLAAGFLAAELRALAVATPVVWTQAPRTVEGWVVDVASPGSGGGRLLIAPYAMTGVEPNALPARVRISVGPTALVGPGQAVRLRAIVGPSPEPASPGAYDFARDAWFQRIGGVGFSLSDPLLVSGPRPPPLLDLAMTVNAARWSLARRMIDDMGAAEGGVAVAMTTGHEAWLKQDDVDAMRNAGLSHILSISGVHMAIVGGFVFVLMRVLIAAWPWLALRVPGKKVAAAAALLSLAGYLVLSGAPPPAVRSAVTLGVAFTAVLADRRAITLHALAIAALIVLALQPEAVVQPGFQMSFAATAALIALAEAWPRPVKEINAPWPIRLVQGFGGWLLLAVAASFVAGAATAPFAIQHFNRVSSYGLPANLIMEPLSTFVIMPALALGVLQEAGGLGGGLLQLAGWGIEALRRLAEVIAAWPQAVVIVASAPAVALPISFLGLLWLCLWKGRMRWLGLPAALAVMLWPRPAPPAVWIASDGGAAAVHVHRTAVFLRPEAKQFAAQLWARRRGLIEPKDADAALAGRFDCDRRSCIPLAGAPVRLAAWWSRKTPTAGELGRLCAGAEVVVVRADPGAGGCPQALVLSGAEFARGGSAELWPAADGWRVVWANPSRGQRPWIRPPAAGAD